MKNEEMKNMWFDKGGKPIDDVADVEKLLKSPSYRWVRQEVLPDGKFVSTVWLALNHEWNIEKPPLIFETMVFEKKGEYGNDLYCERYSTLEEAEKGHEEAVKKFSNPKK